MILFVVLSPRADVMLSRLRTPKATAKASYQLPVIPSRPKPSEFEFQQNLQVCFTQGYHGMEKKLTWGGHTDPILEGWLSLTLVWLWANYLTLTCAVGNRICTCCFHVGSGRPSHHGWSFWFASAELTKGQASQGAARCGCDHPCKGQPHSQSPRVHSREGLTFDVPSGPSHELLSRSGSRNRVGVRITWGRTGAPSNTNFWAPPLELPSQQIWVFPETLYFWQVLRWCVCCWSGGHTVRTGVLALFQRKAKSVNTQGHRSHTLHPNKTLFMDTEVHVS